MKNWEGGDEERIGRERKGIEGGDGVRVEREGGRG